MYFRIFKKSVKSIQKLSVHIDDVGASRTITSRHIELIDKSEVSSVSLLMNGLGIQLFEEYVFKESTKQLPLFFVHLNIVEGKPLANLSPLSQLLDKNGHFKLNHLRIFKILFVSRAKKKNSFLREVEIEWNAQIIRAIERFGTSSIIGLDSHRHTHAYYPLNQIAQSLLEKHGLIFLRATHEKYFFSSFRDFFRVSYYLGVLRNYYLELVSLRKSKQDLAFPVTGIIYSGKMSLQAAVIGVAVNSNLPKNIRTANNVLAIFHPGRAQPSEVLGLSPKFKKWYLSENRQTEYDVILDIQDLKRESID